MNHKLTVDLYYPDSNSSVSVRLNLSEEVIDNILYLAFAVINDIGLRMQIL